MDCTGIPKNIVPFPSCRPKGSNGPFPGNILLSRTWDGKSVPPTGAGKNCNYIPVFSVINWRTNASSSWIFFSSSGSLRVRAWLRRADL